MTKDSPSLEELLAEAVETPIMHAPALVAVQFELRQSIECRGYCVPDDDSLRKLVRAFQDWLWYEVEEHWHDIVESSGVDLVDADGGAP